MYYYSNTYAFIFYADEMLTWLNVLGHFFEYAGRSQKYFANFTLSVINLLAV